jgi:hypothetical protein
VAVTDAIYFLSDEQSQGIWAEIWSAFGPPEFWSGSEGVRTFILASIRRDASAASAGADTELSDFLRRLDAAFSESAGLLAKRAFSDVIALWSPIASSEFFDTNNVEWNDKPYYRNQIGSGICQLFIAHANLIETDNLAAWIELVVGYLSRMIELTPIDPQNKGYFFGNETAASVQNYNLAMALKLGADWMKGWSPDVIAMTSKVSETEARRIQDALAQRVQATTKYLQA